jgi:pimeloyl-ACP methyl ester carboxylesterase
MNTSFEPIISDRIGHRFATINSLQLHYVVSGQGPVVVLLHGMLGTWYTWRHVIPALARHYTVVAPDLRGFGDSAKPPTGYDKKTLAGDIHALLDQLGHENILLAGHDFGGPIAYALAAAYPKTVRRLAVFESLVALPTAAVTSPAWFIQFFQTPAIPEALLKGHEREFIRIWMDQLTINKAAVSANDLDEYARTYTLPGAVQAGAELYRAFPTDIKDNGESSKQKLTMPVMAFGADHGMKDNTLQSFQAVAEHVRGGVVPDCGHFVPEERPEFVIEQLLSFFGGEHG